VDGWVLIVFGAMHLALGAALFGLVAWLLYGGSEGGEDDGGIGRGEGAPRPWQPRPARRIRGGPPRRPDLTPSPARRRVRVR